jgi:hypothetical protein
VKVYPLPLAGAAGCVGPLPPTPPVVVQSVVPTNVGFVIRFGDVIGVCALTPQELSPAIKNAARTATNFIG